LIIAATLPTLVLVGDIKISLCILKGGFFVLSKDFQLICYDWWYPKLIVFV
jgi:hypothetical protein